MRIIDFINYFQRYEIKTIIHKTGHVVYLGNMADIPAKWLLKKIKSVDIWKNGQLEICI